MVLFIFSAILFLAGGFLFSIIMTQIDLNVHVNTDPDKVGGLV